MFKGSPPRFGQLQSAKAFFVAWPILAPKVANWRGSLKFYSPVDLEFLKRVNPLKINPKNKVFRKKAVFGHFQ